MGKFADVRDDLRTAIESRGLVIDLHSRISQMLERTGKDVGSTRQLYAGAEAFVFCSARLSRKMMEADPANISFCPYSLTVYATADRPDRVVVSYRRPRNPAGSAASQAALLEIERLLEGIAREAAGQ